MKISNFLLKETQNWHSKSIKEENYHVVYDCEPTPGFTPLMRKSCQIQASRDVAVFTVEGGSPFRSMDVGSGLQTVLR